MKKMLICFVILGMIAGCSQQISDENEELPISEENQEQEFFIYTIDEKLYDFGESSINQYYTGVQTLQFGSKNLSELNEALSEESNQIIAENAQNDQYEEWRIFTSRAVKNYEFGNIISFVIKDTIHANHVGGMPRTNISCYHIDKNKNEVLSNTAFLHEIGLDSEEVQAKIDEIIKEESDTQKESDMEALWHVYGTQLSDDSVIDAEDGYLNMIITVGVLGWGKLNEAFQIIEIEA